MEELNVVKFLINRVDLNIEALNEYNRKCEIASKLTEEDEKNGIKHTFWSRRKEVGCEDPCCKAEIKDTLKLIRKLTIDIEKKLR